jgi:HEAT repeat protein
MKRSILNGLLFLCMPVGILVLAIMHRPPMFEGKEVVIWFNGVEASQSSPGLAAFKRMGRVAVPVLQQELKSEDVSSRVKAAWLLGQLGPVASNAIPDLVQSLDDPVNNLPIFALQSLATIAPVQMEEDVPKLLAKLNDSNEGVINCAADLLAKIEQARKAQNLPTHADEYEYDMTFLRSSAQRVRLIGLQRLMQLSPKDERVVSAFKALLNDSNVMVRGQAEFYLKNHES